MRSCRRFLRANGHAAGSSSMPKEQPDAHGVGLRQNGTGHRYGQRKQQQPGPAAGEARAALKLRVVSGHEEKSGHKRGPATTD